MANSLSSPATNSGKYLEAPCFQHLLPFDPNGLKKEVYDPRSYRALLRKHLNDHARKAKPPQRNPDAGGSSAQSYPCGGDTMAAARARTTGGGRSV